MADVTLIRAGRWGLSRAVQEADGGWTTYASQQRLAATVEHYWPPQASDGTPLVNAVLVRGVGSLVAPSDNNTVLFPRDIADLADITLGDLTGQQRNAWRNTLETWLTGYTFTDYDGAVRVMPPFADIVATYTTATTLRQIALDIFRHLAHSASRVRAQADESHNTEYLDDFSTDPFSAPRWTNERGTAVWDSVNGELDCSFLVADWGCRYSQNGPGSVEHEAQVTTQWAIGFDLEGSGAAVRMDSAGVDDWYYIKRNNATTFLLYQLLSGSRTLLATLSFSSVNNDFVTHRIAATGAVGSNVTLDQWITNHGSSKPSDPGWYGTDGSPDHTYTDSSANRLDASSHEHCGIAGGGQGVDRDNRADFWKSRAISDRSGAGRTTKNTRAHPLGVEHGMGFRMAG